MFDSRKTENELANLSALARSIRANSEKVGRLMQGEGALKIAGHLLEGIERMCDIVENKLSLVEQQISEVKKDV